MTLCVPHGGAVQCCGCCGCKSSTDEEIEAKLDDAKADRGFDQLLGSWTEMWAIM